jgi:alpha-1,3/alpha-1,6-mannosyltransferase
LNIAFLHPDLGLGGAERLILDAARVLQDAGHRVTVWTSHRDRDRCFEAARDGTVDVRVHGDFLPVHVGQRLRAPCMILRSAFVAAALALRGERFDLVFCDLVAHTVPLLRLLTRAKVVFYCHFPDLMLTRRRRGWYRFYRLPIDAIEQWSTGHAHRILVNSEYTARAFRHVFSRLRDRPLEVLHPGVDVGPYPEAVAINDHEFSILCLGRFEPAKNHALALRAFAQLRDRLGERFGDLRLVVAGGFDSRLAESRATVAMLKELARDLGIEAQLDLCCSPTEAHRLRLLAASNCVVHTAPREHFGYVPVEAMAAGRPVIAVRAGGARETVRDGETGFLCAPTPEAFADGLATLVDDASLTQRLGAAARERVVRHFSLEGFGERLDAICREVTSIGPLPVESHPVERSEI